MSSPFETMLDKVEWKPIELAAEFKDGSEPLPIATHAGFLTIGGVRLRVFQLNDGRRIIACEDLDALFGGDE